MSLLPWCMPVAVAVAVAVVVVASIVSIMVLHANAILFAELLEKEKREASDTTPALSPEDGLSKRIW